MDMTESCVETMQVLPYGVSRGRLCQAGYQYLEDAVRLVAGYGDIIRKARKARKAASVLWNYLILWVEMGIYPGPQIADCPPSFSLSVPLNHAHASSSGHEGILHFPLMDR
ncbi:hypothetical protein LIA77_04100 [Sarocladium implicatum]|nr:hypothetical protein LIA77_04100 [Sarocladium implicatum]